jgi:hypothetical protein
MFASSSGKPKANRAPFVNCFNSLISHNINDQKNLLVQPHHPTDTPTCTLPNMTESSGPSSRPFSSVPMEYKILDMIYGVFPVESLKDIPNIFTYLIVGFMTGFISFIFLYSVIYGYKISRNEQFLSLSNQAGSCSSISKVIDSQFMADVHGNWEGQIDFEYRYAIYAGTLNNFNGNEVEFNELLREVFEQIDQLGEQSYRLDLAENLVIWMASSLRAFSQNQVHTIQFTGDPKIVFNSQYIFPALSNQQGNCEVAPHVSYDRSVGVFTISYPIDQYLASPTCMAIVNPYHCGYRGQGPLFTLLIDMQSAITAIGINTGVIDFNELEIVPDTRSTFSSQGVVYETQYYFYPRYPGMTPLQCVNSTSTTRVGDSSGSDDQIIICAISYGQVYAYPLFNHLGASFTQPMYCDCENTMLGVTSKNCNYMNLIPGLLFYDFEGNHDETGYQDLVTVITRTTGRKLNRLAYNASADSVMTNQSSAEWRERAFEFCTTGVSRGCSLLTIAISNPPLATVSQYYYQVRSHTHNCSSTLLISVAPQVSAGSCNNSFSISKSAQEKLLTTPPTPLREIYYECTRSKYDSFVSAVGVSVGNAVIVRNLLILLLISCFVLYHRFHPITETYTNKEREKVLHFLAFNLLLARDGLYQHDTTFPPAPRQGEEVNETSVTEERDNRSVIKRLQTELSMQTNVKRFYSQEGRELNTPTAEEDSCGGERCLEMGELERKPSREPSRSSSSANSSPRSKHLSLSNERVLNPLCAPTLLSSPPN